MTTFICCVTPQSLIKVGTKAEEFISVLGPTLEYTKNAKKIEMSQEKTNYKG